MADLPQTRHSLLLRLANHSHDAWVEFVRIYEQAIVAFTKRKGLQEADALDLSQEVLQAVEAKIGDWKYGREAGSFRGWIFRVARNIAVDKTVARTRGPQIGLGSLPRLEIDSAPESQLFDLDFARQVLAWSIEKARPNFSTQTWQAFWMTTIERRPPAEAAKATGLTVGNVYAAKFRVISKLKKLAQQFQPSELTELPSGKNWSKEIDVAEQEEPS